MPSLIETWTWTTTLLYAVHTEMGQTLKSLNTCGLTELKMKKEKALNLPQLGVEPTPLGAGLGEGGRGEFGNQNRYFLDAESIVRISCHDVKFHVQITLGLNVWNVQQTKQMI